MSKYIIDFLELVGAPDPEKIKLFLSWFIPVGIGFVLYYIGGIPTLISVFFMTFLSYTAKTYLADAINNSWWLWWFFSWLPPIIEPIYLVSLNLCYGVAAGILVRLIF